MPRRDIPNARRMEILEKHSGRSFDALYTPITLNQVTANRIVSTPYSELYAEAGMPTERYIRYHEEKAEGGIGLTMGGASSVSLDSPQLWGPSIDVTRDAMIPHFQNLDSAVHRHGTAIMIQLTHLGRRSRSDRGFWPHLVSPSGVREPLTRGPVKVIEIADIKTHPARLRAGCQACQRGRSRRCRNLSDASASDRPVLESANQQAR